MNERTFSYFTLHNPSVGGEGERESNTKEKKSFLFHLINSMERDEEEEELEKCKLDDQDRKTFEYTRMFMFQLKL